MSAFREAIAREVRKELMNPEFDSRRSKNGGRVFWVRKATSAGFAQFVKEHPPYDDNVAAVHETMASAKSAVVADRGDEIRVGVGHSEIFTAVFCLSTSGVKWVGEGSGNKKPSLTISGAIHGVAIEADGIEFENFDFPVPGVDEALSMIRVKASGVTLKDITGVGGGVHTVGNEANNFVDCIRVIKGSNDLRMINVKLVSEKGAVPNSFLSFEGSTSRFFSSGFYVTGSVGTAGVIDAAAAVMKQAMIDDWRIAVGGSAKPAVTLDSTGSQGMVTNSRLAGTHTTLANNAQFAGDWRLHEVTVSEETGNVSSGAIIPAADTD